MRTAYIVSLIAMIVLAAMPFKIRQGGNGYQESMNDATAGINELGQAFNDAMTAGTDAIGAATQTFTNLAGGLAGAMGGATATGGAAAGGRLQQGGNGIQEAMNQGMQVFRDLGEATEDFLNSGEAAFDATIDTTDQMIDQTTNLAGGAGAAAGGRLQQGGNGFQNAMAQGMQVFRDLGQATEDALNAGEGVIDATVDTTDQLIDQTTSAATGGAAAGGAAAGGAAAGGAAAGGAAAGGRLQQGGNGFQDAMNQGMQVFRDLGQATEDFLNSGEDAVDATVQTTDQMIDQATSAGGAAATGGRR